MTCEWRGTVGVRKVMLAGGGDSEEEDSDFNCRIESSCATRAAALSFLLGVPL